MSIVFNNARRGGKFGYETVQKIKTRGGFQLKTDALYKAAMNVKLQDISPTVIFHNGPCKDNNWALPKADLPRDLPHRILSFLDQQEAAVDPRAMCKHFVEHPTNPVKLNIYDAMIGRLLKYGSVYRQSVMVDQKRLFFYKVSKKATQEFAKKVRYYERRGLTVPPVERVSGDIPNILQYGKKAKAQAKAAAATPEQ